MTSFFDTFSTNSLSFHKNKQITLQNISQKEEILFQGFLFKKGKILKFWTKRYYLIVNGKLLYMKKENSKKIKGELDLNYLLYEKFDFTVKNTNNFSLFINANENSATNENEYNYGVTFKKNADEMIKLATNSEEDYRNLVSALQKYCVCLNFKEDYSLLKVIGKGNFAKVFLAYNNICHKRFAVKGFSKKSLESQLNGKRNITNEINILRMMNHENIVKLYEVYETESSIYLILELLEGGELFQRIPFMNNYENTDIKTLMKNILSALAHMHEKGVMHRDIKPDNILLESAKNDYAIRIADFGLATLVNDSNILYKRCGTPGFIAPEIISYKEGSTMYNEKCDIFSAGLIFYILIHGKSPFQATNCKDILTETISKNISFEKLIENGDEEMAIDLLKKMLDKDPKTRISASQALGHPYFCSPSLSMECIDEVKENIRIYNKFYEKEFISIENQWLIRPGMENPNVKSNESIYFFNKIGLNGKIQTLEKMSRDSNLSIKMSESPLKFLRSNSASKASRTKSEEMGKILINSFSSSQNKGIPNIFDANNYINLMGENKKQSGESNFCNEKKKTSGEILVNFEIKSEKEEQISGNTLDENRTALKLEDIEANHNFFNLIKDNMK